VQSNSATTFKVRTDLVVVHVVVRDARGNTIGNLRKQDFELFDDHKQQIISNFSVETPPSPRPGNPGERDSSATEPGIVPATTVTFPQKFIAFYFDDLHLPIIPELCATTWSA
jgi:VWFA-related protein